MQPINSTETEIEPREVEALLNEDTLEFQLVDVREDWELTRGVLPGAIHLPLSKLAEQQNHWQSDTSYIVYCEHGIRSLDVVNWLADIKKIRARSMRGGFAQWRGSVESHSDGSNT